MIYILNLDTTFNVPGYTIIKYESFKFPGGEQHIKIDPSFFYLFNKEKDSVIITSRIRSSDDLILTLLTKDVLDRNKIKMVDLFIPYTPYARQDRVAYMGEPLSMKVIANLINAANFNKVTVLDAHSDVSLALINNVTNMDVYPFVCVPYKTINTQPHLVFPDSGAFKKYYRLTELFRDAKYPISASKHRNTDTGKLNNFSLVTLPKEGADCLIIDDICDGGRTFIEVAKLLKDNGAKDVYLYVTHGIFSNGFEELKKYFTKIYCTNSFQNVKNDLVSQLNILTI